MKMYPGCALLPYLAAASLSGAFAEVDQNVLQPQRDSGPTAFQIAIIGAGAAGSSAAYHLSQFARDSEYDLPLNITIFEAADRIGGRTTTVNAFDDPRYPVELGASIFVEINHILFNASRDFGLQSNSRIHESSASDYDLGIWDGESFVFTVANRDDDSGIKGRLGNWWDMAKLLWTYGLSPIRLRNLQQATIGRFLRMYDDLFPFADLTEGAKEVGLLSTTSKSGSEMLKAASIGEKFSREVIQASSRVNYAQNLPDFHGLETMVCMSTQGAMSIDGGNWQIFDQMVKRSGATIHFNTTIHEIRTKQHATKAHADTELYFLNHEYSSSPDEDKPVEVFYSGFDTVVLAAPYNPTQLQLTPPPSNPPQTPDYVSLHVTLFTTSFRPSPSFFNLGPDQANLVPDSILTTLPAGIDPSFLGRGVEGVGPTKIWSLSTLRVLNPSTDGFDPGNVESGHIPGENLNLGKQYLYKIFSPAPLSAENLMELFGWCGHPSLPDELQRSCGEEDDGEQRSISALPKDLLTWHYEKRWDSYPYLPPTKEFDCFDLYHCKGASGPEGEEGQGGDWKGKLWYTSGIEKFISTMETSALSGRNVARLIIDQLEEKLRAKQGRET